MIKGKKKIIVAIFLLFLVLFPFGTSTYATINEEYGDNGSVQEGDLDGKMKNNVLLDAIAQLIYALASWIEYLVGAAFQMLTGANMFPWADRVIFNTIPFLDVNFLNPAEHSLFKDGNGQDTPLAEIVVSIYSTVFTLAVAFLGVVVGLMAIKLAVSSLASEKAKYKEALMKFLFSIVALFGMHYAMSFIFYINESLVEMASTILTNNLENQTLAFDLIVDNDVRVDNFLEKQNGAGGIPTIWANFFGLDVNASTPLGPTETVDFSEVKNFISDDTPVNTEINGEVVEGASNKEIAGYLLANRTYAEWRMADANGGKGRPWYREVASFFWTAENDEKTSLGYLYADINLIRDLESIKIIEDMLNNSSTREDFEKTRFYEVEIEKAKRSIEGYLEDEENKEEKKLYDAIKSIEKEREESGNANLKEREYNEALLNYYNFKYAHSNPVDENNAGFISFKEQYISTGVGVADFESIDNDIESTVQQKSDYLWQHVQDTRSYYKLLVDASKIFVTGEMSRNDPKTLISNMGQYFKDAAWSYETDDNGNIKGWYANKLTLQGAILYAIFVVQSIMFFFAYIKRFFYVVILALLAPVIVIYDFLGKVAS